MLSKKYYQLIAEAIKISKDNEESAGGQTEGLAYLVGNLQARFERDNYRFNAEVFKKACGF